jgi:outer membrane protein OmpA-like peptidoglycan-associated protein
MKKIILAVITLSFTTFLHAQTNVVFHDVEKLPAEINSESEEIMPLVTNDGKELFFVRANHKKNVGGPMTGHDIWKSERLNFNTFSSPDNNLKKLNNIGNNAVVGISKSNTSIYVLNAYKQESTEHHGIAKCSIEDGKFGLPKYIEIPGMNFDSDFFGYYINPSETLLFISMHMPDAMGKEDIYVSTKKDSSWSKPVNLGSEVNSSGFEMSPYLSHDETRLYFASDGHGGSGSADIFYCEKIGDGWLNWSKPINLGPHVNSSAFDAYFVESPDSTGYFASNRENFHSDLYALTITISEIKDIVEEPIIQEVVEPVKELPEIAEVKVAIEIPTAKNIYFDNNRYSIREDAKPELDKIVDLMIQTPGLKLSIVGHTDQTNVASGNLPLSKKRSHETLKYLVKHGINSGRITTDGFGESQPAVKCKDCTEKQLQQNRRVEFRFFE